MPSKTRYCAILDPAPMKTTQLFTLPAFCLISRRLASVVVAG